MSCPSLHLLTLLLYPQTGCLSQLHRGLFLYQGLLQALAGTSPELSPTLDMLQLDVANFATTVWQQVSLVGGVCGEGQGESCTKLGHPKSWLLVACV